jgi:hypothetical protein
MGHRVARCVVTCRAQLLIGLKELAEPTGLEPATSDVTGRRSNQLNYDSALYLLTDSIFYSDYKRQEATSNDWFSHPGVAQKVHTLKLKLMVICQNHKLSKNIPKLGYYNKTRYWATPSSRMGGVNSSP